MSNHMPPGFGSESQNLWFEACMEMGGQFWPPESEESEMPQVGAKFPMMLYKLKEKQEVTVYDEEEYQQAKKNGFEEHPSLRAALQPEEKEKPHEEKLEEIPPSFVHSPPPTPPKGHK